MDFERALVIAARGHRGQVDKNGEPYILHPLRVAMSMDNNHDRIVAILHDVIEDTDVIISDLIYEKFDDDIIEAVDYLTHRKGDSYEDYITKIIEYGRKNPVVLKVKFADLDDNLDMDRIPKPISAEWQQRLAKYQRARMRIMCAYTAELAIKA